MVSMLYKQFGFTTGRLREISVDKRLNKIVSHGKKSEGLMFIFDCKIKQLREDQIGCPLQLKRAISD